MVTAARFHRGFEAARDGRLKVFVERIMALGQVNDALRLLAERKVLGKLVLDLRG